MSIFPKPKTPDMLDDLFVLHFFSATRAMAAATIGTILGDGRQEFPTTQLKDELVFMGGRDATGNIPGPEA
jgi:hypothetical protein